MNITRPPFESVPLAAGLKWRAAADILYEEKHDGTWHILHTDVATLAGELMRATSGAPRTFIAFDCLAHAGADLRPLPLRERLAHLDIIVARGSRRAWPTGHHLERPAIASGAGGDFLKQTIAHGGEGIIAKHLDTPWGHTWFKCKRQETFDLLVTEKHEGGKSSIHLGTLDGADRGWCPCRRAFDHIAVGDVVEIAAFGLTHNGKLREPRFIRIRKDKRPA